MTKKLCRVVESGNIVDLVSPSFVYTLDISAQLKAMKFINRLCDKTLEMGGGLEFEVDLDSAYGRIYIDGWKVKDSQKGKIDPDTEEGYVNGFCRYGFNDSTWDGYQSPVMFEDFKYERDRYKWARTHVFIPEKFKGRKISINIGGNGLLDFKYLRVFINGMEIGTRIIDKRWHEPGCFELEDSDERYSSLRFGQDNIVALQLTDYACRNKKLDEYDPLEGRELATIGRSWPGQFEQFITAGHPLKTPIWIIRGKDVTSEGESGGIDFKLESKCGNLSAVISYRWNYEYPTLHKFIKIQNNYVDDIRLMNLRLGDYRTNLEPTEGEQGFPVYLDGSCFMSVAHPSGWTIGQECSVVLKQYPGKLLHAGEIFSSMETVLGVSGEQKAREAFLNHVKRHMRRVKRGRDKATYIFDSFGSWPIRTLELDYGHFPDEAGILNNIENVTKGQIEDGCHFDYYTIEFWNDYNGDFERPGLERFPNGLGEIKAKLNSIGTALGLWIDTSSGRWSIGGNPVVKNCRTYNAAAYERSTQAVLLGECYCRAADPYRSMLTNGFLRHIRENNVRLLKLDDAMAVCHNPNHEHLPGIYSTEAIQSAEIDMLNAFDRECPDVFIVLYWGHRSPWWLLYTDTLFESGLFLEASTPASFPTLYARDGVTLTLDQADYWCEDVPKLGKDSLGVWLSEWAWNSSIKKERWQEGILMDMCRGSLLFQFWSDYEWLSPEERKQAALFMELLKKGEDCFRNSKRILGNPWKYEPYGYCCSNGKHAFISINNCTWSDINVTLNLNEQWGFEQYGTWDIYRWYPDMAKLEDHVDGFCGVSGIALRPFEVVLLEVIPHGELPSIQEDFKTIPIVNSFTKPTRKLALSFTRLGETKASRVALEDIIAENSTASGKLKIEPPEWSDAPPRIKETLNNTDYIHYTRKVFTITTELPQCRKQGILFISAKMYKDKLLSKLNNVGIHFTAKAELDGIETNCEPVIGPLTYAVPWQGWRIKISESNKGPLVELSITAMIPDDTDIEFDGYYIPSDR